MDFRSLRVRHPFWYATAELEADVGTEATYLVTADDARRVGGTEVSPCRERSAGAAAGPGVPTFDSERVPPFTAGVNRVPIGERSTGFTRYESPTKWFAASLSPCTPWV